MEASGSFDSEGTDPFDSEGTDPFDSEGTDPFDSEEYFVEEIAREGCLVAAEYPWRFAEALRERHWYYRCSCLAVDGLLLQRQHQSSDHL